MLLLTLLSLGLSLLGLTLAQHNAPVGPLTALSTKSHICNVKDYGGVPDNSTDVGLAITRAFKECIKDGSTLVIPEGTWAIKSSVTMRGKNKWAFQLDGLIVASHAGTIGGNLFVFQDSQDLEVFSSNGKGAINGQGYVWRIVNGLSATKPRIMRFMDCIRWSVHDLILVDAGAFHLVVNDGSDYEIYNITIRGPNVGGSDGIDVSGTNYYVHDVEVSNRDECVCVKSPSAYGTIARVRCNSSGGMSIGSLQTGADVHDIVFDTVDVHNSTQGLMIKTYPSATGTNAGSVNGVVAKNFSAYITQYWQSKTTPEGNGVQLNNITFDTWSGSNADGYQRGAVVVQGSVPFPAKSITVRNFSIWSEIVRSGIGEKNRCSNAKGQGSCLTASGETKEEILKAAPQGWKNPGPFSWGVAPYPVYAPIPVYQPVPKYPLQF